MDNTIMIHAGHYVDCTLGVTFGLSTLAAAVSYAVQTYYLAAHTL